MHSIVALALRPPSVNIFTFDETSLVVSSPRSRVVEAGSPRSRVVEAGIQNCMFTIYWIISQDRDKTYIGYTGNFCERIKEHRRGSVRSTKHFGNFSVVELEYVSTRENARIREKHWKSSSGRKKLSKIFNSTAHSSSG